MDKTELDDITERIIGAAHKVSNTLGIGFVEKVYENAHAHEMRMMQALNYLRASGLPACLLINFGTPKAQIRRLHPSPTWKAQSWKYAKQ